MHFSYESFYLVGQNFTDNAVEVPQVSTIFTI